MKIKKIKELIEKDKPKKVTYKKVDTDEYWCCPNCGATVSIILTYGGAPSYATNPYCHVCGQRLDWYVFTPEGK